jgi:hypothetical protein
VRLSERFIAVVYIGRMESAQQQFIVPVFKTEGVGFEKFIGPFPSRELANIERDRHTMATVAPLTPPTEPVWQGDPSLNPAWQS